MDSFQSVSKRKKVKRKKFRQFENCFNDELRTNFETKKNVHKQEKNSQKFYSVKEKKLLALRNKSEFKEKLHTTKVSGHSKLKGISNNNVNNSFKKSMKSSLSPSLPNDIPGTSINKLNNKKFKLAKNVNFKNANTSFNQIILEDKNLIKVKKTQKHIKMLKKHQNAENTNDIQEPQNIHHKKFKKEKRSSLEEKNMASEDSEDDIEIRKEIQNSSIFKKITKLLKENPSLSSNPLMDDEQIISDRNSDESSSSECAKNNESTSISVNKFAQIETEKMFKRTPNTNEKANLPSKKYGHNFLSQTEGNLIRDHVNKSEKRKASTSLRNKAREKLQAAKFRFLNEKLYTESGKDSFAYFQDNQDEFQDYHIGYNLQISKWPMNPVDKIIFSLQSLNQTYVIADMGCGDAKIARTLSNCTVHSFDLVALNENVTPCNISKVPLPNESVNVVVFCLSLMGTNWKDYLREAHRILKMGGTLKIAEVESRIEDNDLFIKNVQCLGFTLEKKDVEHKLFIFLDFKKEKKKKSKNLKVKDVVLKPCLYKKR